MPVRPFFHACLALFTGLVLVKINMPAQVFDLVQDFNGRAMLFSGDAPDQYRVLPFALMRAVYEVLAALVPSISLNAAIQVFNALSAFLLFEINYRLLKTHSGLQPRQLLSINLFIALGHAYAQILYWKPDTLFMLAACLFSIKMFLENRLWGSFLSIVLLSFCRADVALLYALFFSFYNKTDRPSIDFLLKTAMLVVPVAAQFFLQKIAFPEARYFCDVFQLKENLRLYRFLIMPFTWLLICLVVLFNKELVSFYRKNWKPWRAAFLLMVAYCCSIFLVARVSEWRLYLPLLPLLLHIYLMGKKTAL